MEDIIRCRVTCGRLRRWKLLLAEVMIIMFSCVDEV